jgi:hypothetical protein
LESRLGLIGKEGRAGASVPSASVDRAFGSELASIVVAAGNSPEPFGAESINRLPIVDTVAFYRFGAKKLTNSSRFTKLLFNSFHCIPVNYDSTKCLLPKIESVLNVWKLKSINEFSVQSIEATEGDAFSLAEVVNRFAA